MQIVDFLVKADELKIPTKAEARRLIEAGAVRRNGQKIINLQSEAKDGIYKVGKRRWVELENRTWYALNAEEKEVIDMFRKQKELKEN